MQRERIQRLKELFDDAMVVVEAEWSFGKFKREIENNKNEADEIFTDLLREAD